MLGLGSRLVAIGLVIGLAASAGLGRVLARFLPLVNPKDWLAFGAVTIRLAVLALIACYVPARRATRLPVMTALRHE